MLDAFAELCSVKSLQLQLQLQLKLSVCIHECKPLALPAFGHHLQRL